MNKLDVEKYKFVNGLALVALLGILIIVFAFGVGVPTVFDKTNGLFGVLDVLFIVLLILLSLCIITFVFVKKKLRKCERIENGGDLRNE